MRGVFRKVALVLGLLVAVAVAAEGLAGFVRMTIISDSGGPAGI